MATTHRPRNIRDIAHIYLSRRPRRALSPTINILLAASGKDCFSGFHVANMAAAFSVHRVSVRVFELSGLVPNAAFYFSHPPAVYLRSTSNSGREFSPGLNAIALTFDSLRLMSERPDQCELQINLVHLPTLDEGEEYADLVKRVVGQCRGGCWGLYLSRGGRHPAEGVFQECMGAATTFALSLATDDAATGLSQLFSGNLGSIDNWEGAVKDRVAIVLRNPNAGLSRDYIGICESMLNQINSMRRNRGIERIVEPRIRATR